MSMRIILAGAKEGYYIEFKTDRFLFLIKYSMQTQN